MNKKILPPSGNCYKWIDVALILFASVIWGVTYAAQRQGAELMPPLVFLALRSWIGITALLPICIVMDLAAGKKPTLAGNSQSPHPMKDLFRGGLISGFLVFAGCLLQQWGLAYSTAGKAGFLTTLYSVIVPFLGIFFHRKVALRHWAAVLLVLAGTYLLCVREGLNTINKGDFLLILCAIAYSGYILSVDFFAKASDAVRFCWAQFFAMAVFSTIGSLLIGSEWNLSAIKSGTPALLFCGIGATAIAYSCQIVGQKYVSPAVTTILLCTQSVFGVLGGCIFLHEVLTGREICGCAIIMIAVLLAQIPLPHIFQKKG